MSTTYHTFSGSSLSNRKICFDVFPPLVGKNKQFEGFTWDVMMSVLNYVLTF